VPVQGGVVFNQESCLDGYCGVMALSLPARRLLAPSYAGVSHLRPLRTLEPILPAVECDPAHEACPPGPARIVR
jgi:hypothetical protein